MPTFLQKTILFFIVFHAIVCAVFSQNTTPTSFVHSQYHTLRAETKPIIDGVLEDACWKNAEIATDFTTRVPTIGQLSAQKTEVRLVYDNEAIYVSAYLYDTEPNKINKNFGARDELTQADRFEIGLDTYNDDQNGFKLIVMASGVQFDGKHSLSDFDVAWDAVWESAIKMQKDGWSVEIKIPYSALRFPNKKEQTWGVQFVRHISRLGEVAAWSPGSPYINGIVNQWGDLLGLEGIKPPLRLSFTPYIASYLQNAPIGSNPVKYANSRSTNGGMDVKYGINESFTLDMTLIPDFGQVQSDNVVLNLSPFEVKYDERRPFFTEGTDLFGRGGIFYSRRIGSTPSLFYEVANNLKPNEVVSNNPSQTQLYNATKFSGRTPQKLGIGFLNAVGAPMFASIKNTSTGETRNFQTAVLTNYNVFVLDQLLPNNSGVSFTNTSVIRNGAAQDADVSALRFNVRDKKNRFDFRAKGIVSQIFHPNASSDRGYATELSFSKISEKWRYGTYFSLKDKKYNPNDLGLLFLNNEMEYGGDVSYNILGLKGKVQSWNVGVNASNLYRYAPRAFKEIQLSAYGEVILQNFWQYSLNLFSKPIWYYDYAEPRTEGKKYRHAPFIAITPAIITDKRQPFNVEASLTFAETPRPKDPFWAFRLQPTWRITDRAQLSHEITASKNMSNFGFVKNEADKIIFGRRNIDNIVNTLAFQYGFSPRSNITLRTRYYWSRVNYQEYLYLRDDGNFDPAKWQGNYDKNFNAFNTDLVYTWQFAAGSFLNLIWKDAIVQNDALGADNYVRNFNKTFGTPQTNTFSMKFIYYLDYLRLRN